MLKLKEGVTGFIYDSQFGSVENVFTEFLNEDQIKGIRMSRNEWGVFFTKEDDFDELFEIASKEGLENDCEGLNKVLEWVDSTAPEQGMFIDDEEWEKEMGR